MKPEIFGLPAYHLLWGLGIAVWIAGAGRLGRRGGFAAGRSMLFAAAMIAAILVGAKAQHLWENPQHLSASWSSLLLQGYRLPGGLALVAAIVLIGAYGLRLPILPFVDTVIPLAGVSLAVGRLGCFLNGCCFGRSLRELPWSLSFPKFRRRQKNQFLRRDAGTRRRMSAPVNPAAALLHRLVRRHARQSFSWRRSATTASARGCSWPCGAGARCSWRASAPRTCCAGRRSSGRSPSWSAIGMIPLLVSSELLRLPAEPHPRAQSGGWLASMSGELDRSCSR